MRRTGNHQPRNRAEEPGAGRSQPHEIGLHRQHVARAAHAAQRHHRLYRRAADEASRTAHHDQDKQLNTIRTSARHLLSLINDILDVAKIEAGKVTLALERCSARTWCRPWTRCGRWPRKRDWLLTLDLPPEPVVIDSDKRALTQIIINLVNNAIKFTDSGAVKVALGQRLEEGQLVTEFSVTDTGAGIRAEDQSKLFQAFSQLDSTSTRHAEGAGLGLYLCQNLANLLGGKLFFHSEFGAGSTFILALREKR
jgi:two-component system sensor histidine kinase/response regulator